MDELVRMISQRTGIGEDQARQAIMMVLDHIKKMLPEPFASQLDRLTAHSVGTATATTEGPSGAAADQPAEQPAESGLSGMIGKIFRG